VTEAPTDKSERSQKLRSAYTAANTALRESHREEFERLYQQKAQELGVDYKPRPTAEQRAQEQMEALLNEYPQLREQFGSTTTDEEQTPESSQAQRI
jgi:hypothetical protein